MLFLFLQRLFAAVLPAERALDPGLVGAFFGALLFLVHPAAVYGVAYLIQRSIVMATLFGLVSLYCFLEGLMRGLAPLVPAAAAVAYFVAVFSGACGHAACGGRGARAAGARAVLAPGARACGALARY